MPTSSRQFGTLPAPGRRDLTGSDGPVTMSRWSQLRRVDESSPGVDSSYMQPSGDDKLRTHVDESRLAEVLAANPELAAAMPDPAAATVIKELGTPLHRQVEAAMTSYADRPALADRAAEPVLDPATGRTTLRLLPRYDAITYREVRNRVAAIAADWHERGLKAGDIVCTLGFTSGDYTVVDLA